MTRMVFIEEDILRLKTILGKTEREEDFRGLFLLKELYSKSCSSNDLANQPARFKQTEGTCPP